MFTLNNNKAFGLDLSDISLKIAHLKNEKNGLVLASYGRKEIPEGEIENGEIKKTDELIEIIKTSVKEVKGLPLDTNRCVVSLPETESFIQVIRLPKMKKEELKEAIKWEAESYIPIPINEVYFDWQVIQTASPLEGSCDVLFGALSKKLVDPYLLALKSAGLKPVVFEIESVATVRSLIKDEFSSEPIMLVDLGAERSSFIIFSGYTIHFTASSSISNDFLIEEIARNLKISKEEAKKLKYEIGLDRAEGQNKVYGALLPSLNELVSKIQKYIEFYRTHGLSGHSKTAEVSKILLCGGGANLEGLPAFLAKELKMPVEMGNPWVNILKSAPEKIPELPYEQSIGYATALGLALRGVRLNDNA